MTPEEALAKYNAEWPALNAIKEAATTHEAGKKARQALSHLSVLCRARHDLNRPEPELSLVERVVLLEQKLAAKDALLRKAQEALMAVSPLMIPGVTWSCAVGTMIKAMVREAVEAIDKELT